MAAVHSILAVFGLVWLLAAPAASAQDTPDSWTSPTYGFTVSWDPAAWEEEPAEALVAEGPDELDRLLLLGELGPLYIEGVRRHGGSAPVCAAGELSLLTGDPAFSDISPLPEYDADGPNASARAIRATLEQESGEKVGIIAYVHCERAGPDSVAIGTLIAPAGDFPGHLEQAEPVLASIVIKGTSDDEDSEFANLLALARADSPAAGPTAGALSFGPGVMATVPAGVSLADFAASATFANPADGTVQPFDFGFAFRHLATDDHFRLVIDSAGAWELQSGLSPSQSGTVGNVRSGEGESNTVELVARGDDGWFSINGEFAGRLDLSSRSEAGDVLIASGFYSENATVEDTTRFTRFAVWPLPAAPGPFDAGTFSALMTEASAQPGAAGPLDGSLTEVEGTAALVNAGVALADFTARLTWENPGGSDGWDVGVAFRDQPDGRHYRLTFDQTGRWAFGVGTGEKISTGAASSMLLAPGDENTVELVVIGETAGFAINGVFVDGIDVSEIIDPGDVWIGAGFNAASARPGRLVEYRGFTVWPAEDVSLPADEPVPAEPAGGEIPLPPVIAGDAPVVDGPGDVRAVRLDDVGESGVSGLATITDVGGEAFVNIVVRGGAADQLAIVHAGTCADLSVEPVFLLEDPDSLGRSKSGLGVPVSDLLGEPHAIAIYADAASYGEPLACGEIG